MVSMAPKWLFFLAFVFVSILIKVLINLVNLFIFCKPCKPFHGSTASRFPPPARVLHSVLSLAAVICMRDQYDGEYRTRGRV